MAMFGVGVLCYIGVLSLDVSRVQVRANTVCHSVLSGSLSIACRCFRQTLLEWRNWLGTTCRLILLQIILQTLPLVDLKCVEPY